MTFQQYSKSLPPTFVAGGDVVLYQEGAESHGPSLVDQADCNTIRYKKMGY